MKKNWWFYILFWQISGVILSLIISIPKGSFHAFLYYLMFSLSFTNIIAISASVLLLIFDKKIKHKLSNPLFLGIAVFFIIWVSVYTGIKIVPPVVHSVCSMEVAHEVDNNHIYMVAVNILLSVVILAAYAMIFIYHKLKTALEIQFHEIESLKRLNLEARFAILQSKINPHFLFNTMNTMLDLIYKSPQKVEEVIINLSDIYRKVLNLPDNQPISLKEEIKFVKSYLDVEKIRFNERLEYDLNIENKFDAIKIPPLIIQTLVENAVIHGISVKKNGGKITVETNQQDNQVIIIVKDNGVGIKPLKASTGFGLYGVQERLKLFYKDKARLVINRLQNTGTEIRMTIPYEI